MKSTKRTKLKVIELDAILNAIYTQRAVIKANPKRDADSRQELKALKSSEKKILKLLGRK